MACFQGLLNRVPHCMTSPVSGETAPAPGERASRPRESASLRPPARRNRRRRPFFRRGHRGLMRGAGVARSWCREGARVAHDRAGSSCPGDIFNAETDVYLLVAKSRLDTITTTTSTTIQYSIPGMNIYSKAYCCRRGVESPSKAVREGSKGHQPTHSLSRASHRRPYRVSMEGD